MLICHGQVKIDQEKDVESADHRTVGLGVFERNDKLSLKVIYGTNI